MHYSSLSVEFILLNFMVLRCIHFPINDQVYSLYEGYCVYVSDFLHSSSERHIDCFQDLIFISKKSEYKKFLNQ